MQPVKVVEGKKETLGRRPGSQTPAGFSTLYVDWRHAAIGAGLY